ncbi:MAG: tellurite resistance TerB family protein [Candidatus Melainabacteria bacterium]|nr:tellurite resistance TerB family protein [Candidatus Melainabacteria bacterium]
MPSFLDRIRNGAASINADLTRRVGRFKNSTFLQAAMAASALIVAADGKVEDSEVEATSEFINSHPALACFEPGEKAKLFQDYVVKAQGAMTKIELNGLVAKAKGNNEMATTLMELVIALAASDGDFAESEKVVARKIAANLGLNAADYV